jgi:hypothetical protein
MNTGRECFQKAGKAYDHHYYVGPVGKPSNARPTEADLSCVQKDLTSFGLDGTWKFAKTLYENAQGLPSGNYQRVLHLLLKTDRDGTIEKVRLHLYIEFRK